MVCIHGVVTFALIASAQATSAPSIGAARLEASMTEEEKQMFSDWYLRTLEEESEAIQITVLESLFHNTSAKVADVVRSVNLRHPNSGETPDSVEQRYADALWGGFVPMWFHETLRSWPGILDPPSEPLLDRLTGLAKRFGPPVFSARAGLARAISAWNAYCIVPLRLSGSAPPCVRRDVRSRDRIITWMVLRPSAMQALVGGRLTAARAMSQLV